MGRPYAPESPKITPDELTRKTRTEIRYLARQKGLIPTGRLDEAGQPRQWKDPVTEKERLRLDRGHVDKKTGQAFDDPKASVTMHLDMNRMERQKLETLGTTIRISQLQGNEIGGIDMTPQDPQVVELSEEVYLWIEQDTSIHLKAVTKYGDPVELSAEEARELAKVLEELAKKIDE